jgi:hypothetical protein
MSLGCFQKLKKTGGGRMSSGCSQTSQKNGGGRMSSGCSQTTTKQTPAPLPGRTEPVNLQAGSAVGARRVVLEVRAGYTRDSWQAAIF